METKTIEQPKVEVAVRTLASDEKEIAKGSQHPTGEIITPVLSRGDDLDVSTGDDDDLPRPKHGKAIALIIVLLALAAIGYYYIYPALKGAFTGKVT